MEIIFTLYNTLNLFSISEHELMYAIYSNDIFNGQKVKISLTLEISVIPCDFLITVNGIKLSLLKNKFNRY